MIDVGVVGGTGYTGVELLRLLALHPEVEIKAVTSRQEDGKPVADFFPNLKSKLNIKYTKMDLNLLKSCDLVFFATPHAVAMKQAPPLLEAGVKVIDISADYRVQNIELWQEWYGETHQSPNWVKEAVYGLPEINREMIKQAQLIACPGCYPTAVQLGLIPLLKQGLIDAEDIVADVKSGISGAGKTLKNSSLYCEAADSFSAYAVNGHRHQIEIEENLSAESKLKVKMTFIPHLVPMSRGIHATIYCRPLKKFNAREVFKRYYQNESFVEVLNGGEYPSTRSVRGSNKVHIAVETSTHGDRLIVLVTEDNLVKGASGQAVQNMNIMFGLAEDLGLNQIALLP